MIGGSPYVLNTFIEGIINDTSECQQFKNITYTSYVAKIEHNNMNYIKTNLTLGESVNYIGGMLVHQNGYIYAVSKCILYKIDPYDLTIVTYIKLPYAKNTDQSILELETIYNGMQVIGNGRIILKGFLQYDNNDNGVLLQIEPINLEIIVQKFITDSPNGARLSIYNINGNNYIYTINNTNIEKILITNNDFIFDNYYSIEYRTDTSSSTPGSALLIFDKINKLTFTSNTECGPVEGMTVYNYDLNLNHKSELNSKFAFSNKQPGYNFWMVASDNLINQFVICYDPITKQISCNKILENGEFILIWEKYNLTISACVACVADRNHLYIDDYVNGSDYFVILELTTGYELGRIKTNASLPTIGSIFPGMNNDVYLLSNQIGEKHGYITRIYV